MAPYTTGLIGDTATVQKIITEILAPHPPNPNATVSYEGMTFAKDSRDLLIECCVEFITMISSEANEIAEKDAKKTIACEHITKALEELGFGEYVPDLLEVAQQFKQTQAVSLLVDGRWRVRALIYHELNRVERRSRAKSTNLD